MNHLNNQIELNRPTPYYHYDTELLGSTLNSVHAAASQYGFHLHYAMKANSNYEILDQIFRSGFGADCVSGNEMKLALEMGVQSNNIVLAGVGKTDEEIKTALENNIACLNVESLMELNVISDIAIQIGRVAQVAIRVNPNIDAKTHKNITTGLKKNKFGIAVDDLPEAVELCKELTGINLSGLHFHIGSQIMDLSPYIELCILVNQLVEKLTVEGVELTHINLGGGLGINYFNPDIEPIPNFDLFFKTIHTHLNIQLPVHFELGRSIVAQCGTLVTRILFEKRAADTDYLIVDAGMTELMRPALYQASHKIQSLAIAPQIKNYSVVGPVCESTDTFGDDIQLPDMKRGDILLIRSAGAYGECMANAYNLRQLKPASYYRATLQQA